MVNQYCAHSFARNWQLPFLNQRKGENDRRKYFMINLHERMLPTSAGVEPATSWSPVGRRIQLSHRGRLDDGIPQSENVHHHKDNHNPMKPHYRILEKSVQQHRWRADLFQHTFRWNLQNHADIFKSSLSEACQTIISPEMNTDQQRCQCCPQTPHQSRNINIPQNQVHLNRQPWKTPHNHQRQCNMIWPPRPENRIWPPSQETANS